MGQPGRSKLSEAFRKQAVKIMITPGVAAGKDINRHANQSIGESRDRALRARALMIVGDE